MRTLLMTAVLLSVAISAEAQQGQRVPFMAPDPATRSPVVAAPGVVPPGEVMVFDMAAPPISGLPAPAAPGVDALPRVMAPLAPLEAPMTVPGEPLALLPTAPRLDPTSTRAPSLTSPEDVVEEVRQLQRTKRLREERRLAREARSNAAVPVKPDAPASAATPSPVARIPAVGNPTSVESPNQAGSDQPTAAPPGQPAGREEACSPAGDLTKLLSAACLETLRALRAPGGSIPPSPSAMGGFMAQPQQAMTQCAVSIFAASGQTTMVPPFPATGLEPCLAMGARMSYGVPGLSNITAVDPVWGVVAVSCRRETLDGGAAVTCEPQQ